MARQLYTFVTGRVGNAVMYNLRDIPVVRSLPAKVHKTPNMQTCSSNFGTAVRAGKNLRQAFAPLLLINQVHNMHSKFSGDINRWLGAQDINSMPAQQDIPALDGFNFNPNSSFYERFKKKINLQVNPANQWQIDIPAFNPATDLSYPAHTTSAELNIAVGAYALGSQALAGSHHYSNRFDIRQPQAAARILFDIPAAEKMLLMATASVSYFFADGRMEEREPFMPVTVLKAMYKV